jgi:hypothetical protein
MQRDTALCLSMVPPGRKSVFRAGFRGVHTLFVSWCQGTCRCPRHDAQFRSLGVTTFCVIVMGLELENNDSCQKRSSLGVGAIGGCAQQRCRLVCVPWHGTRCAVRLLRSYKMYKWCRSSHAQDILFPIWSCALVMQFVFRDARYA